MQSVLLCITIGIFVAAPAFAQSTYGTLLGTVTDASGAVLVGATVTVTDVDTNTSKTTTTNSGGEYEIPNLLPGTYDVAITAKGFNQYVRHGIPLDPRASVRVDASLQVGAEATIVEVTGRAPVITTENATVTDVKEGRQISQLPLNYRGVSTSPLNALTTIPNIQVDSGGPLGSAAISIGGNHPAQNEFTVDGFSVLAAVQWAAPGNVSFNRSNFRIESDLRERSRRIRASGRCVIHRQERQQSIPRFTL